MSDNDSDDDDRSAFTDTEPETLNESSVSETLLKTIHNISIKNRRLRQFLEGIDLANLTEGDIYELVGEDIFSGVEWTQPQFVLGSNPPRQELRWHTIYRLANKKGKEQLRTQVTYVQMFIPDFQFTGQGGKRKRKTISKKYSKKKVKRRSKKTQNKYHK